MRRSLRAAVLVAASLLFAGCSANASDEGRLSVYAASSLTEVFGDLESLFEERHPGTDVALTLGGSQVLRIQIEEGAPADVFASANPEHMRALRVGGLVRACWAFARNELVLVVPSDNPAGLESFADLPMAQRLVLGTQAVPVGRYAREALAAADSLIRPGFESAVLRNVVSEEPNVRLARSKVELGEADAAIVYRTDALSSERVQIVPIPDEVNVRATYLIGEVLRPGASELAEAWIELVRSAEGRRVLDRYGFELPMAPVPVR